MTVAFDHREQQLAKVLVRAQLGHGIAVAACDPRQDRGGLWPVEREAVARAVNARKLEFQAGRFAARQAMEDLGLRRVPIPSGPDRAPVWPAGVTGSISHNKTVCVAAVARTRDVLAIGIDLEQATPLDDSLLSAVCTEAERGWLSERPTHHARILAKLIFSGKESAYKAQYILSRQILDFHCLSLEIDPAAKTFSAVFQDHVAPFKPGYRMLGRFSVSNNLIVTSTVLRPDDPVSAA